MAGNGPVAALCLMRQDFFGTCRTDAPDTISSVCVCVYIFYQLHTQTHTRTHLYRHTKCVCVWQKGQIADSMFLSLSIRRQVFKSLGAMAPVRRPAGRKRPSRHWHTSDRFENIQKNTHTLISRWCRMTSRFCFLDSFCFVFIYFFLGDKW